MTFRAERARAADSGPVRWVVIDEAWSLHLEAYAFLELIEPELVLPMAAGSAKAFARAAITQV